MACRQVVKAEVDQMVSLAASQQDLGIAIVIGLGTWQLHCIDVCVHERSCLERIWSYRIIFGV